MSTTTTPPKSAKTSSSAGTIDVLNNGAAKFFSNVHPAVLLSSFFFTFSALVKDPVPALIGGLLPLSVLQTVYAALCLPGSNASSLNASQKPGQKKKGPAPGLDFKIVPAILSLVLSLTLGTPLIAIALVLFGAPVTSHQLETVLCAAHMSLLSSLPLIYAHGVDAVKWRDVASLATPVDEVFGASLGTLIGAWIGAVPIPLDWDREWQRWPVTIVTGAYIGFAVGKIIGGYVFKGARIKIE